ncbi:hypothetical protein FMEXI_3400 [Fusarium mexicanum]|uniref:Uncharacterized protein n=1 Tax=Fusarium mexicanum TaxID=751941 RepID=A0A8H5JAD2_9HYPO|nr:hypothetical protein FMEXI_3400 [Fusarium mexicanum]
MRKVKGMRAFRPNAPPTNPRAWGVALDAAGDILAPDLLDGDQMETMTGVLFKMRTHRACILEEAKDIDRNRFREYMKHRALNIGIVIGEPRSGKTRMGAAAALCMAAKLGQILCSGPSHPAIDLFASRLDTRSRAVAARYNTILPAGHPDRRRHHLVIRMYAQGDELLAINQLLNNPQAVDWAQNMGDAVPALDANCKPGLRAVQNYLDNQAEVLPLRQSQVARGAISWAQYTATPNRIPITKKVMGIVMREADFLCVHPTNAEISPVPSWRSHFARGLVVDDAGSMNRADFYGLWGNTLLPVFLVGDPDEKPVVLTTDETDSDGNLYNQFAADGAVSPLKYLMATGIPVFRL